MGGIINTKDRLPIGVSEADMVESKFKWENNKLRQILAKLVNNKSNSIEFKRAKQEAIDILQTNTNKSGFFVSDDCKHQDISNKEFWKTWVETI